MVNVTRLVAQPPRNIIKYINLLSLRIDDSLATDRLKLLYQVWLVNVWLGKYGGLTG